MTQTPVDEFLMPGEVAVTDKDIEQVARCIEPLIVETNVGTSVETIVRVAFSTFNSLKRQHMVDIFRKCMEESGYGKDD